MSCKTFNLKSCEIRGATYQGRKIDFVNKVITQDTFTAKVYDTQGYLLTEIIGIKSGSVVYFPFTAIQNLSKDKYRIKYWADFYLLGTILLGEEELTIGNSCPNCEVDDSTIPFVLELGTETIDFTLQLVYIAIGNGSGEVDLLEYIKKVDADESYALKNHTHSYNDLTDLPPNQNIDSVVTIGAVTATTNNVNFALHFSGVNRVYIGGENYYKVTEDNFSFTPVTTGIKVLLIYALPDSQIFYLAEGVESAQAVEPTGLPTNALLVARLIASSSGTTITIPTEGFQLKANEAWVNLLLNDVGATVQTVSIHHAALRFNIISGAANIKIGGFRFYATQFLYDGIEITLRNETAGPLEITTIAGIGIISIDADGLPITLKQFESISFAYHLVDGVFYALKSGGEVFDPTSLQGQINTNNTAIDDLNTGKIEITTSSSITTNTVGTVSGKGQHYRTVFIKNGVNAINITCEVSSNAIFTACYYKLGSGTITFLSGAGVNLIQVDGDNKLNGAIGSTAVLTRDGNNFYLRISNA